MSHQLFTESYEKPLLTFLWLKHLYNQQIWGYIIDFLNRKGKRNTYKKETLLNVTNFIIKIPKRGGGDKLPFIGYHITNIRDDRVL